MSFSVTFERHFPASRCLSNYSQGQKQAQRHAVLPHRVCGLSMRRSCDSFVRCLLAAKFHAMWNSKALCGYHEVFPRSDWDHPRSELTLPRIGLVIANLSYMSYFDGMT